MAIATKPELKRLKTALTAKQAELLGGLRNREGIVIEPAADNIDQIQFAGEREITIAKLNLESVLLGKVRAALSRLDLAGLGPTPFVPAQALLREDELDGRCLAPETALAAAPEAEAGFFLVPPIVENVSP